MDEFYIVDAHSLLYRCGLRPIFRHLQTIELGKDWELYERRWINYGRRIGWDLTNVTIGGRGVIGYKFTEEAKQKISAAGRRRPPLSKTARRRIGDAKRRYWLKHRDSLIQAISKSRIGKKDSAKGRLAKSLAAKRRWMNPDYRRKQLKGMSVAAARRRGY